MGACSFLCLTCKSTLGRVKCINKNGYPVSPSFEQGQSYIHHQTLSSLKMSAREQCYICIRLWDAFDRAYGFGGAPSLDDSRSPKYWCALSAGPANLNGVPTQLNIWFFNPSSNFGQPYSMFEATMSQQLQGHVAIPASTGSSGKFQSLGQASRWLSRCITQHDRCSAGRGRELPTRLVKVSKEKGGFSARLCNNSDVPSHSKYLTLSHCWGKVRFVTLTAQNLSQMRKSIPVAKLPRVFQDAMLVTQELGFGYIWIDSLCIIQNSESDWLNESANMYRVYANSTCNLAATSSHNGQEGLFAPTDMKATVPPEFNFSQLLGKASSPYTITSSSDWSREISWAPLHQRAWVCQEQVLAPRILHFAKEQLYWECFQEESCEAFPNGSLRKISLHKNLGNLKSLVPITPVLPHATSTHDLYEQWELLVRNYTSCDLTCATDKFPALSGLAKMFQKHLKDTYLAGLWGNNLLNGLMWEAHHSYGTISPGYRAPSWSWASVDGAVNPRRGVRRDTMKPLVRVLEATTKPLTKDPTGQIQGGFLRLAGSLRQITLAKHPPTSIVYWKFNLFDDQSASRNSQCGVRFCSWVKGQPPDLFVAQSPRNACETDNLFMMPLFSVDPKYSDRTGGDEYPQDVQGLVLRPEKGVTGTFKKVGIFLMKMKCYEAIFRKKARISSCYYEGFDGSDMYSIRMI
ncbi:HET-domain-containing protein [Aulographum hederae CBS 113979]|uniref:HET-domain-containing protein n=1 Tax=Aulographum hederae CBS 113979 TaxID=1176131 RepID=A0A6G1GND6_9PEZI|nr:HET-domain-containing protein [Aulographum hederae CBS 113979]